MLRGGVTALDSARTDETSSSWTTVVRTSSTETENSRSGSDDRATSTHRSPAEDVPVAMTRAAGNDSSAHAHALAFAQSRAIRATVSGAATELLEETRDTAMK